MVAEALERAVQAGDAAQVGREPLNLFWFAHHTVLMAALTLWPLAQPADGAFLYGDDHFVAGHQLADQFLIERLGETQVGHRG